MPLTLPSDAVRKISNTTLYVVSLHDELLFVTPATPQTEIQLYAANTHDATGKVIHVKNSGTTRKLILTAPYSQTIDGESYYPVEPSQFVSVQSDGLNWWLASNDDLTHQIQDTSVAGVLAVDWELGKNHVTLLTETVTVSFSGGKPGGHYVLVCWQDGVGGHGISWPVDVAYSGNIAPDPALTAGAVDLFAFYYDGDTYVMAGSLYTVGS